MNKKKLEPKDLITVGIFTAIYFTLFFACGMLGYIPILYVMLPIIIPIICGIPFMLFLTKVKCFGMVTIMGVICGGLMVISGHTLVPIIVGSLCGFMADLIFKTGKYQSVKCSVIGYGIFSIWLVGMILPFWIMKDSFKNVMESSMGENYTKTVMDLFDKIAWTWPILAFVAGIVGAFFGFSLLKKHFRKAGIA